jgi:hypothetical protein
MRLLEALKAARGQDYALFGLGGRSEENLSPSGPLLTTFHTLCVNFASRKAELGGTATDGFWVKGCGLSRCLSSAALREKSLDEDDKISGCWLEIGRRR